MKLNTLIGVLTVFSISLGITFFTHTTEPIVPKFVMFDVGIEASFILKEQVNKVFTKYNKKQEELVKHREFLSTTSTILILLSYTGSGLIILILILYRESIPSTIDPTQPFTVVNELLGSLSRKDARLRKFLGILALFIVTTTVSSEKLQHLVIKSERDIWSLHSTAGFIRVRIENAETVAEVRQLIERLELEISLR